VEPAKQPNHERHCSQQLEPLPRHRDALLPSRAQHLGAPSCTALFSPRVLPMKMPHFSVVPGCCTTAHHPSRVIAPRAKETPAVKLKFGTCWGGRYLTESAKYTSSAVTRFRRSDFMALEYRSPGGSPGAFRLLGAQMYFPTLSIQPCPSNPYPPSTPTSASPPRNAPAKSNRGITTKAPARSMYPHLSFPLTAANPSENDQASLNVGVTTLLTLQPM